MTKYLLMIKLLCLRIRYWPASEIVRKSHDDKNIVCYTITMRMIRLNKNSLFFSFILSPNWRSGKEGRERNWGNKIDFPHAGCFFVVALIKRLPPPLYCLPWQQRKWFSFSFEGGKSLVGRSVKKIISPPPSFTPRWPHSSRDTTQSLTAVSPPLPHKFSPPSWTFHRLFPSPFLEQEH